MGQTENIQGVAAEAAASWYARRFNTKLASGVYRLETVSCFCGATESIPVVNRDRHNFQYSMVLCKRCGILYANPRMTKESYEKFYEEEYRPIYGRNDGPKEEIFHNGLIAGADLKKFLLHFDILPTRVIDIGCNMGGMLKAFADDGIDVLGIDLGSEHIEYGKSNGVPIRKATIDDLILEGQKSDFIILHHVLEHLLDLPSELDKISKLLTRNGVLYIGLPGLYVWELSTLFQNAHTYQFTAETLSYVMECCGFEEIYCDQWIASLWQYTGSKRRLDQVEPTTVVDIHTFLKGEWMRIPKLRMTNKFPTKQRREQIKAALSMKLPDISQLQNKHLDGEAIIVGGGPSVHGQIDRIKKLMDGGAYVFSIERMMAWCKNNEIKVNYAVAADASDDVMDSFHDPDPNLTYLIGMQCPTSVFEKLKPYQSYIFNMMQRSIDLDKYWDENNYDRVAAINTGGSVTLACMSLALFMGIKRLHFFGFDCHITNGNYANGISGVGEIKGQFEAVIDGRNYTTTTPYISFAQQFFELKTIAEKQGLLDFVKIYGDSLVTAMSKEPIGAE